MQKNTEERTELQAEREKLKNLKGFKKLEYIWDYYKISILAILFGAIFVGSYVHGLVSQKDAVLYTTLVNLPSDETLEEKLDTLYIRQIPGNTRKEEVALSTLSNFSGNALDGMDTQYVMAMQTRLLADLSARRMDVVLMDQAGFEEFAASGYLLELDALLDSADPELKNLLRKYLKEAAVVVSDNQEEVLLNADIPYEETTENQIVGIDVSEWSIFSDAGLPSPVYLGIIGVSPRTEEALDYIRYLLQSP